ncbi:Predicted nuclease (RNAse H fold) [Rhizobiales bacterium GAS191]|nr:Predicted nuclease (RNAse H fold) [Rhizobiales bacterium GAS191]
MSSGWIAGVDGCRAGWIMAREQLASPGRIEIAIHPGFATILDRHDPPTAVAVDMPIGLPARIGEGGRGPEAAVRRLIGARRSSVFAIPSRGAVEAQDYATACAIAAATSEPPRKVSKQAFMLFRKIREIDVLLRSDSQDVDPPWPQRVFEAHPELAFWRLNGERPLRHPKKLKGRPNPDGMGERRNILRAAGLPGGILEGKPPRGAATDDLLDALALLAIARRILDGRARPHPEPPGRDAHGLPVAIWG